MLHKHGLAKSVLVLATVPLACVNTKSSSPPQNIYRAGPISRASRSEDHHSFLSWAVLCLHLSKVHSLTVRQSHRGCLQPSSICRNEPQQVAFSQKLLLRNFLVTLIVTKGVTLRNYHRKPQERPFHSNLPCAVVAPSMSCLATCASSLRGFN